MDLLNNILTTRTAWLQKLLDPRRDIGKECGHPEVISNSDYRRAFLRGDIATRVVSLYPEESWSVRPEVFENEDETETEFEMAWKALEKKHRLKSILGRADVLSGIGRFGVILLGLNDGLELREPVGELQQNGEFVPSADRKLIYLRAFDETELLINSLEKDPTNPRYGQPTQYQITFSDTALDASEASTMHQTVHWSRVIHIADNRMSSDVYGQPRMEKVFDRLLDLRKIMGGSGEMFWKGGFPGYSLEATPGLEDQIKFDKKKTREEMEAYMNGLQRYIATIGMSVKSLNVQVADPKSHMETQIRMIAMAMGVPWRILMGVEVGQLASEQDIEVWNRRLSKRQNEYLTPFLISPFVERLIGLGVLPMPRDGEFQIEWPDLQSTKDQDVAGVAETRTNALSKYVSSGVDTLITPFFYLTLILGMTSEEATSIIQEAEKEMKKLEEEELPEEDERDEEPEPGNLNPQTEEA